MSDLKQQILQTLLNGNGESISGDLLGKKLGVSRVAVWKHVKTLMESGHTITSSAKGYAMVDPDDSLLPYGFPKGIQERIRYYPTLGSTMDQARELAQRSTIPHMGVVVAEEQTSGRGRLNRQWISSRGGLWFTMVLFPKIPPTLSYIYNFAASLSLSETLGQLFNLDVSVKWPNDILAGHSKLCGLLSEMETRSDMICFLIIGIGINVNNFPKADEPGAVSIREILGRKVSRRDILTRFCDTFGDTVKQIDAPDFNPSAVMHRYRKHTSTIGKMVRIETFNRTDTGRALDIDDSGALLIETPEGMTQKVIYGDCFYKSPDDPQ